MNLLAAFLALAISTNPINPGDIKTPSSGKTQTIGSYISGCISGAETLPANNPNYQITHFSRNRYYGHQSLINFIQNFAQQVYSESGNSLLIGDLSQPRGGFMTNGHASHQNGLDVDIWFATADHQLDAAKLDNYTAPNLVSKDFQIDYKLWNPRLLELASKAPEVERIFVSPPIKKQLCQDFKGQEWLRKIRPWWNHKDHMHVRLHCPQEDINCKPQEPLPAGDGCDESLEWWFSAEATRPKSPLDVSKSNYKSFNIPKACAAIFAE